MTYNHVKLKGGRLFCVYLYTTPSQEPDDFFESFPENYVEYFQKMLVGYTKVSSVTETENNFGTRPPLVTQECFKHFELLIFSTCTLGGDLFLRVISRGSVFMCIFNGKLKKQKVCQSTS